MRGEIKSAAQKRNESTSMEPESPAIQFLFSENDLVTSAGDASLPYLDEREIRWGDRFDVRMQILVDGVDLFRSRDIPDLQDGSRIVHLLDLVLRLAVVLEEGEGPNSYGSIDAGEDIGILDLKIAGNQAVFTADDEQTTVAIPLSVATRDIYRFIADVRPIFVEVSEEFLTHPQLGPWLRGEKPAPSVADAYNWRRAPRTVEFPEHEYAEEVDLSSGLDFGFEYADSIKISFDIDPAVVTDAKQADLSKESVVSLVESFFQMPLSIQVGERQLLRSVYCNSDDKRIEVNYRFCPLLRAVFDLFDVWQLVVEGRTRRRAIGISDVCHARELFIGSDEQGVWFEPSLPWSPEHVQTESDVIVPHQVFAEEAMRFFQSVEQFFDAEFPGIFDRTLPEVREQLAHLK